VLFGCTSTTAPPPLTRVSVQLRWTHDAQFGGFYAADQNGYYAAEGLAVTLVPGGPKVDPRTPVLDGASQISVAGADELILARAEGKPLRAVATIYRRSPLVFIALADSGITRPEDFAGKTIRVVPAQVPTLHAVTSHVGIRSSQYTEVVLPSDLALFASGKVPVWGAYLNGLALTAQEAGYKLNIIYPDHYGVHFSADTVFTTDDSIAANPDLIRRFLRATLKGWTYAVENPTKIGPMVIRYNPKADPALEIAKMTSSLMLVNTGEDHIGWMKPEVWAGMEKTLRRQGVLTRPLDVTQVYTMQFLKELYGK
jgi:NitT/TauT family transport system substrate-binding protein